MLPPAELLLVLEKGTRDFREENYAEMENIWHEMFGFILDLGAQLIKTLRHRTFPE